MKKLLIISVMGLLCFNWLGYRLLCNILQQRATTNLQAAIDDRAFAHEDLLELTAPLDLPYTNDWHEWEAVNGTIVINEVPYQYVERILRHGKMIYRCLPNHNMHRVMSARDRFVQLSYDMMQQKKEGSKSANNIFISNYIGDYDNHCYVVTCNLLQRTIAASGRFLTTPLPMVHLEFVTPPPDLSQA